MIVPRVQVKLGVPEQLPCDGVTVPRVNPAGHVSLRLTAVASDGPALLTVIVYVCVVGAPAITDATPSVFVTDRSALRVTVFVSLALLFPAAGSDTPLVTLAVFVWLAVVDDGTV